MSNTIYVFESSNDVRWIFEGKGEGGQARSKEFGKRDKNQMRKMKTKKKGLPSLRFIPFFCPDLGEDQKLQKIRSSLTFSPFFCTGFLLKFQRGGGKGIVQFCVLF